MFNFVAVSCPASGNCCPFRCFLQLLNISFGINNHFAWYSTTKEESRLKLPSILSNRINNTAPIKWRIYLENFAAHLDFTTNQDSWKFPKLNNFNVFEVLAKYQSYCTKEWIKDFCTLPWHLTCPCQKQKYLYSQPLCSPERKNISDIVWPSQMQKLRNRSQEISYAENFLQLVRSNWQLDQGKHFRISMG